MNETTYYTYAQIEVGDSDPKNIQKRLNELIDDNWADFKGSYIDVTIQNDTYVNITNNKGSLNYYKLIELLNELSYDMNLENEFSLHITMIDEHMRWEPKTHNIIIEPSPKPQMLNNIV